MAAHRLLATVTATPALRRWRTSASRPGRNAPPTATHLPEGRINNWSPVLRPSLIRWLESQDAVVNWNSTASGGGSLVCCLLMYDLCTTGDRLSSQHGEGECARVRCATSYSMEKSARARLTTAPEAW